MAIVLFNPTDEEMRAQYIGEEVVIPPAPKPGHKIRVDDARGRHLLNVLGPRGLVSLEYGDEGEGELKKAEIGRRRNIEFWRKQVMDFNQLNDAQQQRRLPYIQPTPEVKAAAKRLGIKLYEPMSSKDEFTNEAQSTVAEELAAKEHTISALQRQVYELTRLVGELKSQVLAVASGAQDAGAVPDEEDAGQEAPHYANEAMIRKIKAIGPPMFDKWVRKNLSEIEEFPAEVKRVIAEKWVRLYGTECPVSTESEASAA
ncbi:MAG: hypothetical protein WHT06_15880 [Desulfobacterales bacterium]